MNGASVRLIFLAHWVVEPLLYLGNLRKDLFKRKSYCCLPNFISYPHERTNFPLGDNQIVEILIIIWLTFYRQLAN